MEQPQVVHLLPLLMSSVCSAFPCSPVPLLSTGILSSRLFLQISLFLVGLSPFLEGEAQGTCLFPCRVLCTGTVSLRMGDTSLFVCLSKKNLWQITEAEQTQSQHSQDPWVMALSRIPAFPAPFSCYGAICRLSGNVVLMALAP